jgi:NitT/TauT family transport system substrate-binding protein
MQLRQSARRAGAAFIATTTAAIALGACGSGSGSSAANTTSKNSGPVTVQVGLAPVTPSAPIHLGIKKGFFADEGLTLKLAPIESASASIAALVAGSNQFGQAAYFGAISAAAEGVPVKVVAADDAEGTTRDNASLQVLVVRKNSDITTVKDLAGKTIAVNALKSGAEIGTRASLQAQGVAPDTVKYLAVPWANMAAALERGQVDAINIPEPFLTPLLRGGARQIDAPLQTLANGGSFPNSGFLASSKYIAEHPDIVERFARAVGRSATYANAHPDEVREILTTFTALTPEQIKEIRLPGFSATLDLKLIDLSIDATLKTGVIKRSISSTDLVYETARK